MTFHRESVKDQAELLAGELGRAGVGAMTPKDFARGVATYLAEESPAQAEAIALCWWGVPLDTLLALAAAGRWDTLGALFTPPSEPRKHDKHYTTAGRALGKRAPTIQEAVQRGLRSILAWQLAQAAGPAPGAIFTILYENPGQND